MTRKSFCTCVRRAREEELAQTEARRAVPDIQPEIEFDVPPANQQIKPRAVRQLRGLWREHTLLHLQPLIGNHAVQRAIDHSRSSAAPIDDLAQRIRAASTSGRPIDTSARERLETSLEADLSAVKIHTDDEADQLSQALDARAFATGQDIFFREGQYQPETTKGLWLLAHEATHTIQQTGEPFSGESTDDQISISDPTDRCEQAASQVADQFIGIERPPSSRTTIGNLDQASIQRQTPAEDERLKYQTVVQQEPPGTSNIGQLPGETKKWRETALFGQGGFSAVGGISDEELKLRLGYQSGGWNIGGSITTGGDVNVQAGGPLLGSFGGANISAGTSGVNMSGYANLPLPGSPTIGGGLGSSGAWLGGSISPTEWLTLSGALGTGPGQGWWGGAGARFAF